jgi:hypothetical protein
MMRLSSARFCGNDFPTELRRVAEQEFCCIVCPVGRPLGRNGKMAEKNFAGDPHYRLPKGKIEPYRLWFEYLKVSLRHPDIQVDQSIYVDWHVQLDTEFDAWWSKHWRHLFATRAETAVIETVEDFEAALADPRFAVIRVSLSGTKKQRIKDIEDALAGIRKPEGHARASPTKPLFSISAKRSMNLKTLRGMLKFLQLHEEKGWDLEEAALAYFKWSKEWNEKVRTKKWKRPLVYVPPFLAVFVEEIEKQRSTKRAGSRKVNNTEQYDVMRGQARRFIRRGEQILSNVAAGSFVIARKK